MTNQNDLEEHFLVDLHELLVPFINISGLATIIIVVTSARGVILVVVAPLDHLLQNGLVDLDQKVSDWLPHSTVVTYIGNRNGLARVAQILEHVLDQDGALNNGALCGQVSPDYDKLQVRKAMGTYRQARRRHQS